MTRINLRLPERLKAEVEQAAAAAGLSANASLVRMVIETIEPHRAATAQGEGYNGWVR